MKLTCITAVFNAIESGNRENLIRCVKSVAALKIEHEHLIYDGASTDGTVELLRKLEGCGKMPHLRVVSEPDTGIYNALNKGVRDARGEWFYVLGCDDYIEDPELMVSLIEKEHSNVQEIIAPIHSVRDGKVITMLPPIPHVMRWFFNCAVFPHQGRISRTAMIRRHGGFDERYKISGDTNQSFLIHLNGKAFHYTQRPFAMFGSGGASETRTALATAEDRHCVEEALRMSNKQRAFFKQTSVLPPGIALKFWNHPDFAVRTAARWMVWLYVRRCLCATVYPLVVLKRFVCNKGREK